MFDKWMEETVFAFVDADVGMDDKWAGRKTALMDGQCWAMTQTNKTLFIPSPCLSIADFRKAHVGSNISLKLAY